MATEAETVGDSCSTHIETPKPQEASTESQQLNTQKMVTVTAKAAEKIQEFMKEEAEAPEYLRVYVQGGGCSGFQYIYELTKKVGEGDIILQKSNVEIVIDKISQPFLHNATLDYLENLGNAFFQILNPNSTSKCGCGNSFSI